MPPEPIVADLPLPAAADPDLEALPGPRRPGKRMTLATLAITAAVALFVAYSLLGEAGYALGRGDPRDAGDLARLQPSAGWTNSWVRAEAELGTTGAIRYQRPMDGDSFRLSPVVGQPKLWVEIRVPAGLEGPRFVPPTSFVGRLVPFSRLGVRHRGLTRAVAAVAGAQMPSDAWVLLDGEDPASMRWSVGLVGLFVAFAAFNLWAIYRLLRPVER
jgi:hypothetical protein